MEIAEKDHDYMVTKIDKAISELVIPKYRIQKAYNYYNGFRDSEQFRYLEENFGIGNPTSVEFTPLIRKHVDMLVGEYLNAPVLPKVTCKDKETLSNINRDKQLAIDAQVINFYRQHLNNQLLNFIDNKATNDQFIEEQINKLIQDLNENFTSEYEIAA